MKRIFITLLLSLLLISCSGNIFDDVKERESNYSMLQEGIRVNLNLIVEELSSEAATKADVASSEGKESTISNIWIFQFNNNDGTFISSQYSASGSIKAVYIKPNTTVNKIVILANLSKRDNLINFQGTYSDLKGLSYSTTDMLDDIGINGYMPMCGEGVLAEPPSGGGTSELSVKLVRTVAKVKMIINSSELSDYGLDSAFVCNVPVLSYYFPNFNIGGSSTEEYPLPAIERINYYLKDKHAKKLTANGSTTVVFYLPINIQGDVTPENVTMSEPLRRRHAPANASFITIRGVAKEDATDLYNNRAEVYYHTYPGSNVSNYSILPNRCYYYNYNIKGVNNTSNSNIEKSEYNNCYIAVKTLLTSQTITIDAAEMVNRYWRQEKDRIHPNDNNISMKIVWSEGAYDDNLNLKTIDIEDLDISRDEGTTKFNIPIPAGTEGNILVAIQKNEITKWSYHIWMPENNPEEDRTLPSGKIIMQRNLGAIWRPDNIFGWGSVSSEGRAIQYWRSRTFGLYYQWGRKDPFMTFNNPQNPNSEAISVQSSIANPGLFVNNNSRWCSDSGSESLWNDKGKKSIFDPCPKGWKVPDSGVWDNISSETDIICGAFVAVRILYKSLWYPSGMGYLPIPGYIKNTTGTIDIDNRDDYRLLVYDPGFFGIGNNLEDCLPTGIGLYWNNNGSVLYNDKTSIDVRNSYAQSTGASIRCQKL